jgi:hypothetical protein
LAAETASEKVESILLVVPVLIFPAATDGLADERTIVAGSGSKQSFSPTEKIYAVPEVNVPELLPVEVIFGVLPGYEFRVAACSVHAEPLYRPTYAEVPAAKVEVAYSSVVEFHCAFTPRLAPVVAGVTDQLLVIDSALS